MVIYCREKVEDISGSRRGGPHKATKQDINQDHIEKVIFLSAVTRPRFDGNKMCVFHGEIAIWPFVHQVAAQRTSTYRPAGTMDTKSLPVTKHTHPDMIMNNVLPVIKEKWPDDSKRIYLQHENASTHFGSNYAPYLAAARAEGWDIQLAKQPANSPDSNINYLLFFRALQSCSMGVPGGIKHRY